jgi:succinate dehydrogenase / fumarate reductase membrane anchor subunit
MVNRVVTGAHYGLRDWLLQRVSALLMAAYALGLVAYVWLHPDMGYEGWLWLFSNNLVRSGTLLVLLALFAHAWVGVRDIVMDYVKPAWMRLTIHVSVILLLLLYAIWAVQILWGS